MLALMIKLLINMKDNFLEQDYINIFKLKSHLTPKSMKMLSSLMN
jgi:hypothetical protein